MGFILSLMVKDGPYCFRLLISPKLFLQMSKNYWSVFYGSAKAMETTFVGGGVLAQDRQDPDSKLISVANWLILGQLASFRLS